jgi:hypothetical protein
LKKLDHPNFDPQTGNFDLTLLQLSTPAVVSATIGIICLPAISAIVPDFAGLSMKTSGWADYSSARSDIGQLRVAAVGGLSDSNCLAAG